MEALVSGLSTLEKLEQYQPIFTELAQRAERGRVETRYGRRIFDPELREPYEAAEAHMNALLEQLFEESVDLVFNETMQGVVLPTPGEIAEYS